MIKDQSPKNLPASVSICGFKSSPLCALRAALRLFSHPVPLLVIAAFVTALFWAKARDPFQRIEFAVKTVSGIKVKGLAVLPKTAKSFPTAIYLHGSGRSLLQSGKELR
ncbi:MAG: hypothetical protein ACTHLW_07530, partial [Verrucomicrobiota bacterium]